MSTKNQPSAFDGYARAEPDEPYFCLLARDPSAPALIDLWAQEREKHGETAAIVAEARECAEQMRAWRDHNRGSSAVDPVRAAAKALLVAISERPQSELIPLATEINALSIALHQSTPRPDRAISV